VISQALLTGFLGGVHHLHGAAGCHAVAILRDQCLQHHWKASAARWCSAQGVKFLHKMPQMANSFAPKER